ncbi:Uma2 family endonuclease [Saccharothrix sp. 6-C]|uniref:Uma2 family endonuclease n=1 Tax=Saccharothrix sp. 6-C TaxID=2781735 RepID=UPI001916F444|nr:Uma2 family endonuclease [Saccharothrix sp. 6-C]QQQ74978.1 Uma2 family endonuclease [Saccharothrix sp. 6-C]
MALPADYEHDLGHPAPWFRHEGPWTLDDVLALPEDLSQRVELVDGALIVSPLGDLLHQSLVGDVYFGLRTACPPDYQVLPGFNLGLSPTRMLIPDFGVVVRGRTGLVLPVEDLVLAGEVLSPSTRQQDLTLKRDLYAVGGVPFYLLVDPAGREPVATMSELEAGKYVETARSEGGYLKLERPFPVTIELSP